MTKSNQEAYLIYARKFRPQAFEEVVGQEPIVRTLKNSIAQGRIPQNFLFSGPRGVGKTSTARIIAKALNCEKGPTAEPCDKCQSCREIVQGNSLDVLEIDGASNRGIDEVRNLRETVKFKPVAGKYKIYIIDEVHMLTPEAFNALLKTLEEPPVHVKFIFATTEPHKMPLTILSRCQRFNFKRIPAADTVKKLEEIAKKEKIKYEKNVLFLIAKASDGALRDAEGLLDQLVSFAEEKIKESDVLQVLGLASESIYFEVLTQIRAKNAQGLFETVQKMYEEGVDLAQFAKGLFEVFRHLLLLQCAEGADAFVEMSEDSIAELKKRKKEFTRGELLLGISMLNNLQGQLRRNLASPRLLIETTLLKLVHLDQLRAVENLTQEPAASRPIPASVPATPSISRPVFTAPQTARSAVQPSARPVAAKPVSAGAPAAPSTGGAAISIDEVCAAWGRVIEYVKTKKMSNGIFLSESQPVEVSGNVVTLGFPQEFQFHKEMLEKETSRKLVEEAFEVCLGRKVGLTFVITQLEQRELGSAPVQAAPSADPSKLPEIITDAMDIFEGAKIVRKDP